MKSLYESLLDNFENIGKSQDKDLMEDMLRTLFAKYIPIDIDRYIELLEILKEKCEVINFSEVEEFCERDGWFRLCDSTKEEFIKKEKPHLKKNDWVFVIDKQNLPDVCGALNVYLGKLDTKCKAFHILVSNRIAGFSSDVDDYGAMGKDRKDIFYNFTPRDNMYVIPKSLKKVIDDITKNLKP